jgi:carboxymethylenebutenolidase
MHARRDLMRTVTKSNIVTDAEALLEFAGTDPAARPGKVGAVGFCMSGPLAIALARALPDRLAAVASIHGGGLVTDDADSPHRGLEAVTAEVYLGWAHEDPSAPAEGIPVMREALERARVRYSLDHLAEAVHGYAPPGTERYDRSASELHWERVHSLLRRNL